VSAITVIATLQVAQVIIAEAFLSFLGLGVQPPTPAWGNMLGEGRVYMLNSWWIAAFPGLAIFLTTLVINLHGERAARLARPASQAPANAKPPADSTGRASARDFNSENSSHVAPQIRERSRSRLERTSPVTRVSTARASGTSRALRTSVRRRCAVLCEQFSKLVRRRCA
jgi:hypothetical protein